MRRSIPTWLAITTVAATALISSVATTTFAGGGAPSRVEFPLVFSGRDQTITLSVVDSDLVLHKEIGGLSQPEDIQSVLGTACPGNPQMAEKLLGGTGGTWERLYYEIWKFTANTDVDLHIQYGNFWIKENPGDLKEIMNVVQALPDANSSSPDIRAHGGFYYCMEDRALKQP